jgi:t-SNARE complex subunit (syntaxin)
MDAMTVQSRAGGDLASAVATRSEELAQDRLSAGRAEVSVRAEWLDWVDQDLRDTRMRISRGEGNLVRAVAATAGARRRRARDVKL